MSLVRAEEVVSKTKLKSSQFANISSCHRFNSAVLAIGVPIDCSGMESGDRNGVFRGFISSGGLSGSITESHSHNRKRCYSFELLIICVFR